MPFFICTSFSHLAGPRNVAQLVNHFAVSVIEALLLAGIEQHVAYCGESLNRGAAFVVNEDVADRIDRIGDGLRTDAIVSVVLDDFCKIAG